MLCVGLQCMIVAFPGHTPLVSVSVENSVDPNQLIWDLHCTVFYWRVYIIIRLNKVSLSKIYVSNLVTEWQYM